MPIELCLIDRFIRDNTGHYFHYSLAIREAALAAGLRVRVLGNSECLPSVKRALRLEEAFSPYRVMKASGPIARKTFVLPRLFRCNYSFYKDLLVSANSSLDCNSIAFFPDIDEECLLSIPFWLRKFSPGNAPTLVLMLRVSLCHQGGKMSSIHALIWRMGLFQLEVLSRRYKVRLVSDSSRIAEQFNRITRLPITVVPIPHTNSLPYGEDMAQPSPQAPGIHFVTLGGARIDKGFILVLKAIERLSAQSQLDNMTFTLQSHFVKSRVGVEIEQGIQRLKKLGLPNVRFTEKPLGMKEYYAHLLASDVVLLPYSSRSYHSNTSGPFVEALAAGKPVVVTKGTWMDDQLKRSGAGVTFQDQDVDGLARAICEARDEYSCLVKRANSFKGAWIAYHNPANFLKELLKATC